MHNIRTESSNNSFKLILVAIAVLWISGCCNYRQKANLSIIKIPSDQYVVEPGFYYRCSILADGDKQFLALDLINHTDRDLVIGNHKTLSSVKVKNRDNVIIYAQGFKKSARIGGPENVLLLKSHGKAHTDGQVCGFEIMPIRYEIPINSGTSIELLYNNWLIDSDGSTNYFSISENISLIPH